MLKKIFIITSIIVIALSSCNKEEGNPPRIMFDGEGITGVFAGDEVTVTGKVLADGKLSGVYWFHQKLNNNGNLDEQTGGLLELGSGGTFTIPVEVTIHTIGIKIIAEDDNGNRNVSVFPIILGEDALVIAFEGNGYIGSIGTGEDFRVKGTVNSGTPLTSLSYTVVRGNLTEPSVNIEITGERSSVFDFSVKARLGMTGVRINATNRGTMSVDKMFEVREVVFSGGPIILFDKENISVKPDSVFTVSGQVVAGSAISSVSYVVYKEGGTTPSQEITLDAEDRFSFDLTADDRITAVNVEAKDNNNLDGEETIFVTVLYPSRTENSVTYHYKNLIFDDKRTFEKSYFSFDVAPYVLNAAQAKANQDKVLLMYTNVFNSAGHAQNGGALFGANAFNASTISATALAEGWTLPTNDFLLARLPVYTAAVLLNQTGKTFDELGDSAEDWDAVYTWLGAITSNNSVLRSNTTVAIGAIFAIFYGGTNLAGNPGINKYAIGIVRGFGGDIATEDGQSTGAWLDVEIKVRK